MKAIVLLAVLALAAPGAARTADRHEGISGFDLSLERDGGIWKASCTAGCDWLEVRYECLSGPCSVTLDAHGIAGPNAGPSDEAGFAFVLAPTEKGWHATSIRGTNWTKIGFGCALPFFCEARVTERGVEGGRL